MDLNATRDGAKCLGCGTEHPESEVVSEWCGMSTAEMDRQADAEYMAEGGSLVTLLEIAAWNAAIEDDAPGRDEPWPCHPLARRWF